MRRTHNGGGGASARLSGTGAWITRWGPCRRLSSDGSGFTLIEIMVVVLIIGLLATLVVVNVIPRREEAARTTTRVQIKHFEEALKLYYLDNHVYPDTPQGLKSLIEKPTVGKIPCCWKEGGYLEGGHIPKDPWGHEYVYMSPGKQGKDYEILSYGRDGEPGGEGPDKDISNWDAEE